MIPFAMDPHGFSVGDTLNLYNAGNLKRDWTYIDRHRCRSHAGAWIGR